MSYTMRYANGCESVITADRKRYNYLEGKG